MKVLLTNDDGIWADGLQALRAALADVPGVDLRVVAPDGNRSAMARSITTRRPLLVEEVDLPDGTVGYASDGTPVDCVRLAFLGLVEGWVPDLVVSGINHGLNVGDDITYSGTVAAALEATLMGRPGIAISQQSSAGEMDFRLSQSFDFTISANYTAALVGAFGEVPLAKGTLLNLNFPATTPTGVQVARLGKRYYQDELRVVEGEGSRARRYQVYGAGVDDTLETDTDVAAVSEGRVAVTPLHLDLTYHAGLESLAQHDLQRLLTRE